MRRRGKEEEVCRERSKGVMIRLDGTGERAIGGVDGIGERLTWEGEEGGGK